LNPGIRRFRQLRHPGPVIIDTISQTVGPPCPLHRLSLEIGMSQPLSSHTFLDPLFQLSCAEAAGSTARFFGNKFAKQKGHPTISSGLFVKL
jgi:hypothetical protein